MKVTYKKTLYTNERRNYGTLKLNYIDIVISERAAYEMYRI